MQAFHGLQTFSIYSTVKLPKKHSTLHDAYFAKNPKLQLGSVLSAERLFGRVLPRRNLKSPNT